MRDIGFKVPTYIIIHVLLYERIAISLIYKLYDFYDKNVRIYMLHTHILLKYNY